jgi:hypothetical protein
MGCVSVNLNDPRRADARGWGPMWAPGRPARTDMVPLTVGGFDRVPKKTFIGGVHPDLEELLRLIINECLRRGYKFKPEEYGFAWRAVRGTEDDPDPVPTNHSSGTAVDINSAFNYLGRADGGDVPRWMVELFNDYGFRWGGDYSDRKDPMHWEQMGTPADVKRLTAKARNELGGDEMTEEQLQRLKDTEAWQAGYEAYAIEGKTEPGKDWSNAKVRGFRAARRVATASDAG